MSHCLKPVAWMLLALIIALPAMAQASAFEKSPPPAGCDEHSDSMPSQPASYTCCRSGHDIAVLQRAFRLHGASARVAFLDSASSILVLADVNLRPAALGSDSPPVSISLRI